MARRFVCGLRGLSLLALSTLMLVACNGGGGGDSNTTPPPSDTTPPLIVAETPASGSIDVAVNTTVTVTFSEAMNCASLAGALSVSGGSGSISGSVGCAGSTATFTPAASLAYNTIYTATVTTGAKDVAGNALPNNFSWSFTTGLAPDLTPPTVTMISPASGATGVSVTPGNLIWAKFSEAMNPSSLSATTFTLSSPGGLVGGSVNYDSVNDTVTFFPSSALAYSTTYTVSVSRGARDLAGNPLATNFSWRFTTEAAPDKTLPVVVATSPANLANNVATNTTAVTVTFSEAMDCTSLAGAFSVSGASGSVSCAGSTATFNLAGLLADSTPYTATVTTDAKDKAGNALASNYSWTFTTAVPPAPTDTTPPSVTATSPAAAATGVATNVAVGATFSEAMDPGTITASTFTLTGPGGVVTGSVSYSGVTGTFTPAAPLADNTPYTATVTTGAKDAAGNALASNYSWSFTTAAAPDKTPPSIASTSPLDGANGVATNTAVTATFSEAMDAASLNPLSFLLRNTASGAAVTGSVIYSAGTAVLTPETALSNSTSYTATVTAGAKDAAGNALASNYSWTFTTAAAPDVFAPTVSAVAPPDTTTGVAVDTIVSATFSETMNPATLTTATFTLVPTVGPAVTGTVGYSGMTATFTPGATLAYSTVYTATVTTGATDAAGNALAADHIWTFTTANAPDTTPPTIAATTPANGASNILTDVVLTVTFSEQVNCATVNASSFTLVPAVGNAVTGAVACAGTSATFTPSSRLTGSQTYTASLTSAITDVAAAPNHLAPFSWTFTTVPWSAQLGTPENDIAEDIALFGSDVYVTGSTQGDLGDGASNAGGWDAFVAKLDANGTKIWARQLGSFGDEFAHAMATDSGGNVYIAGETSGDLVGSSIPTTVDVFVAKYSPAGVLQWVRQFGTNNDEHAYGIAVSGNDVYIVGLTYGALDGQAYEGGGDAFLVKYDVNGNYQWTQLLSTPQEDVARDVATDASGNVYIAGYTLGSLPGQTNGGAYDYFLAKYDSSGNLTWSQQYTVPGNGNGSELANGIAVSGSDVYITGHTSATAEIAKHNANDGTLVWSRALTAFGPYTHGLRIAAGSGGVYAVGWTEGGVDGNISAGAKDLFVVKYDAAGTMQWLRQLGSSADDLALGVATDISGAVFVSGYTVGDLDGKVNPTPGTSEPFVLKYDASGLKQ
jgi:hypothetical protein